MNSSNVARASKSNGNSLTSSYKIIYFLKGNSQGFSITVSSHQELMSIFEMMESGMREKKLLDFSASNDWWLVDGSEISYLGFG